MKNLILVIIYVTVCYKVCGQGYFNQWYFGRGASLDFNSGYPVVTNNGKINTLEGCASICDYQGNLLFYTDGITIWNRNHTPMPNGTGLMGHTSSTQSALIVPIPSDSFKYYVFTIQDWLSDGDLRYSIIDMSLDFGLGDIILPHKNILLATDFTEKLVAAQGNCGVWVLTHKRNNSDFYSYFIDAVGINNPVISSAGSNHNVSEGSCTGTMKVSPNNQKIALATLSGIVELFDFNNYSGIVSNTIILPVNMNQIPYSVCFSPNNDLLYVGEGKNNPPITNTIYQYDIRSGVQSIIESTKIAVGNNINPHSVVFDLQLGPDHKIYISRGDAIFLDVVNNPNNLGLACNYINDAINIGAFRGKTGLPNALKFASKTFNVNLGKDTILCKGQNITLGDISARSYLWSDGSIESSINISSSGTYWLHAKNGQCSGTDSINILFNISPIINLGNDTTLCEGETYTLNGGSATSYSWSNGSKESTIGVSSSGTYSLEATLGKCLSTDTINILFNSAPILNLGNDTILCHASNLILDVTNSNANYLWQDLSANSKFEVTHQGKYWVEVQNYCGINSDTIIVTYKDCDCHLYIPNVFLPDGNNINDEFLISSNCEFREYNFIIYNRWGEMVFQANNSDEFWDGTFQGEKVPIGVYVYLLKYKFDNNNSALKYGTITLLR